MAMFNSYVSHYQRVSLKMSDAGSLVVIPSCHKLPPKTSKISRRGHVSHNEHAALKCTCAQSAWWFGTFFIFHFIYGIMDNPSHWFSYCSRWLLHHQPKIQLGKWHFAARNTTRYTSCWSWWSWSVVCVPNPGDSMMPNDTPVGVISNTVKQPRSM